VKADDGLEGFRRNTVNTGDSVGRENDRQSGLKSDPNRMKGGSRGGLKGLSAAGGQGPSHSKVG